MPVSLNALIQTYLDDQEFREETDAITQSRDNDLPTFERTLKQFIEKTITIYDFRNQIDKALPFKNFWGLRGAEFQMELSKLVNNHANPSNSQSATLVESHLREILTGLNARNVGERIGQFHAFVLQEQKRLVDDGLSYSRAIFPANSSLIISVFAFWLDWSSKIIYYLSTRQGLKILTDAGLLTHVEVLHTIRDRVVVESAVDHQAVIYLVEQLAEKAPQLQDTGRYWVERFLQWIVNHPEALIEIENDDTAAGGQDDKEVEFLINHKPLAPVSEPLLAQRITQLRERILVDEKVIRRIYHALLAGHVILTGPPGTGKTELAQLIPELLWEPEAVWAQDNITAYDDEPSYTTQLVTATDEWSVRTLIGGLTPNTI